MGKLCVGLLLFAASAIPAYAQIDSGTVIIVGYSKDKVVVAADSRVTHSEGTSDDDTCKIAVLSDNFIFAVAGIAAYRNVNPWNAVNEAKGAFSTVKTSPADDVGFVQRVGLKWGRLVADKLENSIATDPRIASGRPAWLPLTIGHFVGVNSSDDLQLFTVVLMLSGENRVLIETALPPMLNEVTFIPTEVVGPFNEFTAGQTVRAKQEIEYQNTDMATDANKRHIDVDALKAIRLVEFTESDPKSPTVGGPVDAAELRRGGKVEWIQRKSNCPAN